MRFRPSCCGTEVAIVGAGAAGMVAAYELMRLGLKPVVYEAGRIGGRLRSQPFEGAEGVIAELGGMRFPISSSAFFHYLERVGLETVPFPNPLDPATPSTVIDLDGQSIYVERPDQLPPLFHEVADAWREALEEGASFSGIQDAIRARDIARLKSLWNALVPVWDDRSFYDFVATSRAFASRSFRHREVFGQVGFGTGGWDTDFPNSMLEILRVVVTDCDEDQRLVVGGVEQMPRRLWRREAEQHGALAAGHHARAAARRRAAARGHPHRASRARAGSRSWTAGATCANTRPCSSPASPGCSPPTSTPTNPCSPTPCGWRSTAPATCSRPRPSSWSTGRSGTSATRPPAATG